MNSSIRVIKMHSKEVMEDDGYIADPEEAGNFLYENTETFQRVVNVIGKKTTLNT